MIDSLRLALKLYPALRRGGITFQQLRLLARKWGLLHSYEVAVDLLPWPFHGCVQQVGSRLVIFVDSRQNEFDRRYALGHEIGHLLLGHYEIEEHCTAEHGVWYLNDGTGASEWESEADVFATFVCRSQGLPSDWWI